MKQDELKKLDIKALQKEVSQLKKDLFNLKLNLAGGDVKDYSQFKKLRKNIAWCLTFLNEKNNQSNKNI